MLNNLRSILPTIFITAFFLSYDKWYNFSIGFLNFLYSIIVSFIVFLIIFSTFYYWSLKKGLNIEFHRTLAKAVLQRYSTISEKIKKYTFHFPLDLFLMILFGFSSYGKFFPIIMSLSFTPIYTKRIGKEKIEPTLIEKSNIIYYSFVTLWFIYSIVRYASTYSPILEGFVEYYFRILFMFTVSSVIPFQLLFIPMLRSMGVKRGFQYPTIGDILMMIPAYKQITIMLILLLLPVLSIVFPPILYLMMTFVLTGAIWIRFKFRYEI